MITMYNSYRFVNGFDHELLLKYRCPLFSGYVISVSGFENEERSEMKRLIESEGGRYSGEMNVNECTHLIVKKPKGEQEKQTP